MFLSYKLYNDDHKYYAHKIIIDIGRIPNMTVVTAKANNRRATSLIQAILKG